MQETLKQYELGLEQEKQCENPDVEIENKEEK